MENNPNASKMYQKKYFMLLNIIVRKSDQENIWLSDCSHGLRSQPVLHEKVVSHYTYVLLGMGGNF